MTIGPTAVVGRIRRAHGIKGEVVVALQTDAPDAIFAPGARVFIGTPDGELTTDPATGAARELTVATARDFMEDLLVRFEGIADRTAAEVWRGRTILVPIDELEPPDDDELWAHELPGMACLDAQGATIGEVKSYYELPQGYVIEIQTPRGVRDVPFNDAFVLDFDREARTITLDPPAGLLE